MSRIISRVGVVGNPLHLWKARCVCVVCMCMCSVCVYMCVVSVHVRAGVVCV